MIDVDQEVVLQTLQARAMNAVTLQNDRRLVVAGHTIGLQHLIGERQRAINAGYAIVQHHVGLLPHGTQNLAAGERRSDGIAVGPGMRRKYEAVALFDLLEHILQHSLCLFAARFRFQLHSLFRTRQQFFHARLFTL
jgi:hypothetical protein